MNSSTLNCTSKQHRRCCSDPTQYVWVGIYGVIIILGLVINVVLLRILLKGKRSASQVLGLNASVLNIILVLGLPIEIYTKLLCVDHFNAADVFVSMSIFTCPFLLASMCVERYIAVARPIFYLRLNRLEYRVIFSVLVCLLSFVTVGLFVRFRFMNMIKIFSRVACILFAVMLACLLGIIQTLYQRSPAQSSVDMNPMKRRAVVNVLVVLVPAMITYTPASIFGLYFTVSSKQFPPCPLNISIVGFFKFGVFIAPMFYMSHTRRALSWKRRQKENTVDNNTEKL